jgi:xanthine/uracil permease
MHTIVHAEYPARLINASVAQAASQAAVNSSPSWLDITFMALAFLTFALVVVPAVWGRDTVLRDAAFRVLDRILRALAGR